MISPAFPSIGEVDHGKPTVYASTTETPLARPILSVWVP